jgi:hypothetical protein
MSLVPSDLSDTSGIARLEAACTEPAPLFRLSVDGQMEAGTLTGLIGHLLNHGGEFMRPGSLSARSCFIDREYQNTFFITYRAFTNRYVKARPYSGFC